MTFPVVSVVRAALEAPVLAEVGPNDSFQLNASARVPDGFASLPECEMEDEPSDFRDLDYIIPARRYNSERTGRLTSRNETVRYAERFEWMRNFLASLDQRTSNSMAGHAPDPSTDTQQISESNS